MVCRLLPPAASFGLGEVENEETSVSKIILPLSEFPIARLLGETNDYF
jgi:hypothetical protein